MYNWYLENKNLILICLFILVFRWMAWDHFVVPSGSMVPTLLEYDHIVVQKFGYGLRVPFTKTWVIEKRNNLKRGDIVIFRATEGDYFMVKRLIGLPQDHVVIKPPHIWINGNKVLLEQLANGQTKGDYPIDSLELRDEIEAYKFYKETIGDKSYRVAWKFQRYPRDRRVEMRVPEGSLFVLGDNRHNSHDSRFWGFLPEENLMGKGIGIWLSCRKTLFNIPILCLPNRLRWDRIFSFDL